MKIKEKEVKEEKLNLIESFGDFKEFKNIDRITMAKILEDIFRSLLQKKYGESSEFDIIVNADKGDLEIWRSREIVDDNDLIDINSQISYSDAIKIEPDFEIGESLSEEIKIESFGRRSILSIRQSLFNSVLDLEKEEILRKYKGLEGEAISGEVHQIWRNEIIIIDNDGNELVLPKSEQIPGEFFKVGEYIKAVILNVEFKNGRPKIVLSRTCPDLLKRLMESEIPEIEDGLIVIHNVVRQPGEKAKVSVETYDDRIDPVGSCVGMKGSRIKGIVRELRNENIDVINYTTNKILYITRSLSPAKIDNIKIDEENKKASVFLKVEEIGKAIGKNGVNIRLASKLTGYEIEVFSGNTEDVNNYDINLDEFSDEIEEWIIDELKSIGCDTAKNVLELSPSELLRRTELEEETIADVIKILKSEFDV